MTSGRRGTARAMAIQRPGPLVKVNGLLPWCLVGALALKASSPVELEKNKAKEKIEGMFAGISGCWHVAEV